MRILIPLLLAMPAMAIAASPSVQLDSKVFAEVTTMVAGKPQVTLAPPNKVLPGDTLVFATHFKNAGTAPASKVVLTNPVPKGVAFSGESSAGSEVSVDGGRTYGQLPVLKLADLGGQIRAARREDVTTVRWIIPTIAPGAEGSVRYRGIVR